MVIFPKRTEGDLRARIALLTGEIDTCRDVLKKLSLRQERYNLEKQLESLRAKD